MLHAQQRSSKFQFHSLLFEPPWLNRTIYRTRNENANHYTTQAVHLGGQGVLKQCCLEKKCVSVSLYIEYTVKHVHAVTSIEQSPILKGHPFFVLSI
jgi:hypothetical protein